MPSARVKTAMVVNPILFECILAAYFKSSNSVPILAPHGKLQMNAILQSLLLRFHYHTCRATMHVTHSLSKLNQGRNFWSKVPNFCGAIQLSSKARSMVQEKFNNQPPAVRLFAAGASVSRI